MPNKKGSRVAASQARAKAAAKKRTRSAGPDLSGATKPVQPVAAPEDTDDELEEAQETAVAVAEQPASSEPARAAAPTPYRRVATRRERQSLAVVTSGNLRWELFLIATVLTTSIVALFVMKFATTIGR